ncbi:hypothetical protein FACS18942_09590 [Planctomycetales bacterium]|nr:hypothetical protein FACS18942_09590 [Planctomycetales bacterium]
MDKITENELGYKPFFPQLLSTVSTVMRATLNGNIRTVLAVTLKGKLFLLKMGTMGLMYATLNNNATIKRRIQKELDIEAAFSCTGAVADASITVAVGATTGGLAVIPLGIGALGSACSCGYDITRSDYYHTTGEKLPVSGIEVTCKTASFLSLASLSAKTVIVAGKTVNSAIRASQIAARAKRLQSLQKLPKLLRKAACYRTLVAVVGVVDLVIHEEQTREQWMEFLQQK